MQSVLDGICRYFGGAYDEQTRSYRSSPLSKAGVGVVRRAFGKQDDHAEHFLGMPPGTRTGCHMVVFIAQSSERRIALGGEHNGQKQVVYDVTLNCFIRSNSAFAEDAQDDTFALRDALVEHMHQSRTLDGAVFQAGEYVENGLGSIDCRFAQPETKAQLTKGFLEVRFAAIEIFNA
ncbi:hypothetical protein ABZ619_38795 [Streptomyces sp. NPDC007851]|uniref:hypothetical protein n=1 Tax=Streptomyces sp. NPDC007851 TaxID=3155008 RepID=UPI0033C82009